MISEAWLEQPRIIQFRLNRPQAITLSVMANETWLTWSRGTGKTVGVIAPWILHKVKEMPRSSGGFIAKSFTDFKTKIVEPLYAAFSMLGYEKDVHYCYGKKPPEDWGKPLIPVEDYSNVMSWPNGTIMKLISLHLPASANSLSLQWIVGDEAKYFDEVRLRGEVFPILRGNVKHFGRSPWYGAKLFVTDKLSPSIHWILEKKKLMDNEAVAAVLFYQLKLNELQAKLLNASGVLANSIGKKIKSLCKLLSVLRKNLVYYGEAKAIENIENLSADFFENQRRSLTPWEYAVAIDNEDPRRVENNYYSSRTDQHLYNSEVDEDVTKPLAVALDYQASISPLVWGQVNELVEPGRLTLNILGAIHVKQPLGRKNVVDDFCDYYADRPCKEVYYFYDHTAIGAQNGKKNFAEEVEDFFIARGWTVHMIYMGGAPKQGIKFSRINNAFANEDAVTYPVRMHQHRCATLILSMDQTGTIESPTEGTKKDKSGERDKTIPQEQTTHYPDTFDQLFWGVNELGMYPMQSELSGRFGLR